MKGFYNLYCYDTAVLIFLRSAGKFNRKWTNQALVHDCWWPRTLVLKILLSKAPFNPFPESSTCLQSETSWNHRTLGWKDLKDHLVQPSLAKAWSRQDDPAPCRSNLSVQHWGIQLLSSQGYFKGWLFSLWNQHSTGFLQFLELASTHPKFSSTHSMAASSSCPLPAAVSCAFLYSSSFKPEEQGEERRGDKYTAVLSCHHKYLYCEKYHKIIPTVLEKTVLAL